MVRSGRYLLSGYDRRIAVVASAGRVSAPAFTLPALLRTIQHGDALCSRSAATLPPRLLGALALLQQPSELDSEGLGKAVTAAAREGIDDPSWWSSIAARAKALAPEMGLQDATIILNAMARMRRIDKDFIQAIMPRVTAHMIYLTSSQFAMLASAIAKAEVHHAGFVQALTRELKARLMEFQSPMEITMVINAVSKLRVSDEEIYRRLVIQIHSRTAYEELPVRDVSVIVSALSRVQCADVSLVGRFADYSMDRLADATPQEIARLMDACMRVSWEASDFFNACVKNVQMQSATLEPKGLSAAAFAFGQCFEAAEVSHLPYLRKIFQHIRTATVAALPLFLPRELVSLLRTYSRWQISFPHEPLRRVAERVVATHAQYDMETGVSAVYALSVLWERSTRRSATDGSSDLGAQAMDEAAKLLLRSVWEAVDSLGSDVALLLRAVEASSVLRPHDRAPIVAVSTFLIRHPQIEIDGPSCITLHDRLLQLGCSPDEDVMQVLTQRIGSTA